MAKDVIHALVLIQNWGEDNEILGILRENSHIISIYHVMGRHSYLIDANFDDKTQLAQWIDNMKSLRLASGMPAIISIQTQRIIDVLKKKDRFTIADYLNLKQKYHFFVKIDNPHHDKKLIDLLVRSQIVFSILHVQGENSFTIEVIVEDYDEYRNLLKSMKKLKTIHHIETQEVIAVLKYRNQVIDESGSLLKSVEDIRELYTL